MALDTSIYGDYITTGLTGAQNTIQNSPAQGYTPYTSSAANAPTQTQMYDYTANTPMQQINAPNYTMSAGNAPAYQQSSNYQITPQTAQWNNYNASAYSGSGPTQQTVNTNAAFNLLGSAAPTYTGLMNGDYNALQSALQQPGQLAATNAYNTGTQNLTNAMSGRGLYGSSIMGQQQIQGLDREYQNALASNASQAAATRYGMQQGDLQKAADMNMAGYQQLMNQNLAFNSANQQNADRGLQQATNLNALNQEQYLSKMKENEALQQMLMGQSLAQNSQGMQQAQLTQQGLLSNAQNMMAADQAKNQFGLDLYGQKLAEQKDINAYGAQETAGARDQAYNAFMTNAQSADSQNQYNSLKYNAQKEYDTNLNNWQNQQNYEKNFVYPQAQKAWDQAQQEQQINRYLALAGQGAPLATAASNQELQSQQLAAQQAAAANNYTAQLWGAGAGLLGSLGSAAFNNYTGKGEWGFSV